MVEALAPWAFTTHLKDMAVQEYEQGFLLAEVPLGKGSSTSAGSSGPFAKRGPAIRLNLEMITRDPLQVPCLTGELLDDLRNPARSQPGQDLGDGPRQGLETASAHLQRAGLGGPASGRGRECASLSCLGPRGVHFTSKLTITSSDSETTLFAFLVIFTSLTNPPGISSEVQIWCSKVSSPSWSIR